MVQAKPTRVDAAELSRRLLELLVKVSSRAAVEDVHRLRTTVRRLEVQLGEELPGKVAKSLKRLRRKAGRVRDLDVHLGLLETPLPAGGSEFAARQVLAAQEKLRKILRGRRARQLASLRKVVDRTAPLLKDRLPGLVGRQSAPPVSAARIRRRVARARTQFLNSTRRLPAGEAALHGLRIEAKKLRYALEPLAEAPEAAATVAELKQVQDAIGQWHDWATLAPIAARALDSEAAAPLLAALDSRTGREYRRARRTAQRVRERMCVPSRPAVTAGGPHLVSSPAIRRAG